MIDILNNMSKIGGINLIETTHNNNEYKYKFEVFMKFDKGQIKRGYYKFNKKNINKFNNRDIFRNEYEKKRFELLKSFNN